LIDGFALDHVDFPLPAARSALCWAWRSGESRRTLDHLRQGEPMDHKQEHEFHHKKEREREKHREKEAEREQEKSVRIIHPAWFVVIGVLLIVLIVLSWTFFF
jgi:hypothetical protein